MAATEYANLRKCILSNEKGDIRLETLQEIRSLISPVIDPWTIKKINKLIKEREAWIQSRRSSPESSDYSQ